MTTKNRFLILGLLSVLPVTLLFLMLTGDKMKLERDTKNFINGDVFKCHNTLIVSNSNWRLVGDHLINNNSAGYINFKNCVIEK